MIPLRLAMDSSNARAMNGVIQTSDRAQLAATSPNAEPEPMTWPESPTSGPEPTTANPAIRLMTPIIAKLIHTLSVAATALPRNSWVRVDERVRIVFQVPSRSSLAKMSPANRPASSGAP